MKRNHTFNSKSIQWLLFACLTFSFSFFMLLMSSCSDDEHEEVNNQAHYQDVPASLLTDAKKLEMVRSIQDLKDGRFFYLDYTEDYKLSTISGYNLTDNTQLIGAVLKTLCDKTPSWLKARVKLDAGCSAFAVTTPDTGDYLMGRNFDYSHDNEQIAAALVRTAPEGGLKSISMVDAYWIGYRQDLWHYILYNKEQFEKHKTQDLSYIMAFPYLLMDGMNEAGFAVSVLHLDGKPTQQASTGKKLTTTLALRMMLDHAKTVDEALKILDGYDLWIPDNDGNYHFYMADATGRYAIVEFVYDKDHQSKIYIDDEYTGEDGKTHFKYPDVLPNTREVIEKRYASNFYVSETMACSDKGPKLSNHGKTRYDMMEFVIKQNSNQLSEEGAMNLLNGVSQAETPGNPTSHTQWSVVYNLSQRKATVCVNRDYKNKFTFYAK
uniref:carcinine hydrolase/isopenicillin-N N-acyltransferase family protein n=1 Tax=Prevotella sp. TaxID=59823 RepID=UPI0040264B5D